MKKTGFVLGLALFMLSATVITNKLLQKQLRQATNSWERQSDAYQYNYDKDVTWLDVGFRSKYSFMKNYLNINALEKLTGHSVFIGDSPHVKKMDFRSNNKFGHYNPKFISSIYDALSLMLKNQKFKPKAQTLYDKHLKSLARTYQISSARINQTREWRGKEWTKDDIQKTYQAIMAGKETNYGTPSDFLGEVYRTHADKMVTEEYDWYEADTAPGFWIRRSIDGTTNDFTKLLNLVLNELDPNFKKEGSKK